MDELKTILFSCKNKGSGLLNMRVLKDSFDIVGYQLVIIINESLRTAATGRDWKTSTIIPIPKIPGTKKAEELRPINKLPVDEKLLECCVKPQLLKFIDDNNILIKAQSGFRQAHSCETALNMVLSTWKDDIENGRTIYAVFLDFKKAFETIDRIILGKKLRSIGVRNEELKWFEKYLTDREQVTCINEVFSDVITNPYGVPQGSVLGPLLFIIYINDIGESLRHCKINLFADDALITISEECPIESIQKLNEDLDNLYNWLNTNKLKLNLNKTKCMKIGNTNRSSNIELTVNINNENIEEVSSIKYLGVVIDNKLSFGQHIDYTVKKVAKRIGYMFRTCFNLDRWTKLTVYRTIISPYFEYCSSILFLCNQGDIQKLQVQQNKAMRCILKCNRYMSIRRMLKDLGWLSIDQRIKLNTLILIFKIKLNLLPNYLNTNIKYVNDIHSYDTRTRNDFSLPNYKKVCTQNSLYYNGLKLYNSLPSNVKESNSVIEFKRKCKEYVITNI